MPKSVARALATWQVQSPEGVPFVLLTKQRYEAVQRNWQRCRQGLPREGGQASRSWQNRDLVNNTLRSIRAHARQAGLELTAPITVHTFRKSFGQNHADHGTPIHVLQHLMGHTSITTTREFYLRIAQGSERDAASRYEQLLAEPVSAAGSPGKTDARVTPEGVGR